MFPLSPELALRLQASRAAEIQEVARPHRLTRPASTPDEPATVAIRWWSVFERRLRRSRTA